MAIYKIKEGTGRGGSIEFNGVNVVFKKFSFKFGTAYADGTDSKDHDPETQITWRSQYPGDTGMEGSIDGNFDLNGATASFLHAILAGQPLPATFMLDDTTELCSCNVDLMDFDSGVQTDGANMIEFTTSYKSNGKVTFPTTPVGSPNYLTGTPGSTS